VLLVNKTSVKINKKLDVLMKYLFKRLINREIVCGIASESDFITVEG
jgi:hypothetical protein